MADTSSDVAGFISDKNATAIQQTWSNGRWINLGDTNQRNNMQAALNKVGKAVTEQQAGIETAQQAADNAFNQAQTTNDALVKLQDGSTSTIADLANDILARVTKDDLLSQINIASDNILIQSGKLYLDAASTIFGGTAFITDAMITDLNVDKLNAGTMTGVSSNIGNTYTSLLDSLNRYNVTLDTSGMQTGDVYASDLDYTDYVTVGTLDKDTTNTANTSTTATADVTSPTLFTIDGSKLSNGDRVLVKLDINYFYDWTYLGTQIVLQSVTDSPVLFSQQPLDYGYYTYSFVITWSTALGTGKVPFQIKAIGLPPDSNLYAVGANFYTDHGTGTTNYYEAGGALKADGSLHLKDYYSGTASKITNEQYHGYQWDRGTMRLYNYVLEQDNTQTTPVTTINNYETQMDGTGIKFLGNSTDPVLEFFGADVNSLIDSLGQEPWGIDYTGARNLAKGIYLDQYGDIHGYPNSKYWSVSGYGQSNNVLQLPLNGASDVLINPPSGYGLHVHGTINSDYGINAKSGINGFTMTTNNIKAASGSGFYLDNAGGAGGNADLHVKSVVQSSLLSLKTNITEIDSGTALDLINQTEIYDYQFKDDVSNNVTKHYASYIIDDVNDTPQYKEPEEFLSGDKKGRDDGSLLSYAVLAIQELSKQVDTLKSQLAAK